MITVQATPDSGLNVGSIVLWYGSSASVPTGWQICNGTNGTPDLRGVYVRGTTTNSGLGLTGGAATHTHGVANTGSNGSHNHAFNFTTSENNVGSAALNGGPVTRSKKAHSHSVTSNTESGGSHTHTVPDTAAGSSHPPYHRLFYIQRLT